jgi:hypothetical protein
LIPDQVVTRPTQDAQLAEVLSFAIATALEKQSYRDQHANEALEAASWSTAWSAQQILLAYSEIPEASATLPQAIEDRAQPRKKVSNQRYERVNDWNSGICRRTVDPS